MSTDRTPIEVSAVWPSDAEVDEGVVVNWFVKEGSTVEAGETICEIQIEKVGVDVPAPEHGTLAEIALGEDAEFDRDGVLGWIEPHE